MKKYLMFAFAALAFVGCSKSTDVSDSSRTKQSDAYANNFVQKYGQPAANHTWGFGGTTGTRSVYAETNMLGNQIAGGMMAYAPKNVDDATVNPNETKLVVDEFSKHRPGVTNQLNINLTDFWVHQVYKGDSKDYNGNYYKDGFNNDVTNASSKMNHLQCFKDCTFKDLKTNDDNSYGKVTVGSGFMEHIYNFNEGNNTTTKTVDNQSITSPGASIVGATLMINSGTQDFAYHNSTDSKYHNEYIIIAGADIDPTLAGYYYVGFDFYATHPAGQEANKNMDVARDYVFNDWIVRISPAEFYGQARVACEDLGTTDDFDFNDVVFDVANNNDNGTAYTIITVHAAGGTLPLTLSVGGVQKEVHALLGVSTSTMVNTNGQSVRRPIAQFTVNGTYSPKDVDVIVDQAAKQIVLKAEQGKVPQKICVKTSFQWCNERQAIGDKYANFPEWVKNEQVEWY